MHDPKLLVLDEPFVGLDPIASHTMKEKLRQLCDKGGSVFFSSHVLEVVENLCDEIAILKSGSVILNGKTADLLAQSGTSLEELFLERAE
jgi:ABC-2 type transport system ATP-binding protein